MRERSERIGIADERERVGEKERRERERTERLAFGARPGHFLPTNRER